MPGEAMAQQAIKHSSLPLALKTVHSPSPIQLQTNKSKHMICTKVAKTFFEVVIFGEKKRSS